MIPNLTTIDLGRLLAAQRTAGTGAAAGGLGGFELELVHVAAGESWESPGRPDERALIVMDGLGTITVDDWRATLGPGLAALVPARRKLAAAADGAVALALLVIALTPALPAVVDEPSPTSTSDATAESSTPDATTPEPTA